MASRQIIHYLIGGAQSILLYIENKCIIPLGCNIYIIGEARIHTDNHGNGFRCGGWINEFLAYTESICGSNQYVHVSTAVIIVCCSSQDLRCVSLYIRIIKKQGSIMELLFSLLVQQYSSHGDIWNIREKAQTFVQFHQMHIFLFHLSLFSNNRCGCVKFAGASVFAMSVLRLRFRIVVGINYLWRFSRQIGSQ